MDAASGQFKQLDMLLALAGDDLHGYAILKEVARRTADKVKLSAGTLYGNLFRLDAASLVRLGEAERWLAPNLGYENRSPAGSPR